MRKKFVNSVFILVLILVVTITKAQIPHITVDGKSNNGVVLQNLSIEIKVCGTVAKTTWMMTFKNNTSKILEGTLNFPLKDGSSVSRYGLDINGKMREAVPVDRRKGTMVFEAIERRRVDPGLLEKVEGNTFRTRIYPINANGTRTVMIGYEEELPILENEFLRYYMPLNLKDTIADFSLNIEVIQSIIQPSFDSSLSDNLRFDKRNNLYVASLHKRDYAPEHSLSFSIKKPLDATEVMLQEFENKYYYLINTRLGKNEREKQLPQNITLLWDASLSGVNRDSNKEIALLDAYFKKINNANLQLLIFSNKIYSIKKYSLQNGNWSELKKAIDSIQYDGGTNLGSLELGKLPGDEFLLMSDGHQTFGSTGMHLNNKQVYCVNSAANADYSNLKYIALKTGGAVIDLQKDGITASIKKLTMVPFRFLGMQQNNNIEENYPSIPVAVGDNFSAAGIATLGVKEIILQFGYGNKVTVTKRITIQPEKQLCENFDIKKVFAQKKIAELDIQYEENKQIIESVGKRFGIVTRNTSLIVLETVNDYLQYGIEPPAELRNEYNRILKQRRKEITTKNNEALENAFEMMEELKSWWKTVKPVMPGDKKPVVVQDQESIIPSAPISNPVPNTTTGLQPNPQGAQLSISGKIINENDARPIGGATIKIKGEQAGTASDQNGNYVLQVRKGDVLQFFAVGFDAIETRVTDALTVNISLEQAVNNLEEVVVTGYGVQRKRSLTASVSTVRSFNLTRNTPLPQQLEGKVAGVSVTNTNGQAGGSSDIILRGASSIAGDANPLILIDGVEGNQEDLDKDDIEKVEVLKGESAAAIYGARAAKGVVMITTKGRNMRLNKDISDTDSVGPKKPGGSIDISFNADTTNYINLIRATEKGNRYQKYLELRKYYMGNPVYFFEVAGYFFKTGDQETGLKILSNLAEMETGSYELYKMLGYKLKETGNYEGEILAFKKVIELRPMDPQSYRDYALALEDAGQYQAALDQLYQGLLKTYNGDMKDIYDGIEEIFLVEINQLIALHNEKLNLKNIPKAMIQPMPVDLRVVINWNMNNTDIDLWITDPGEEKCMYNHATTAMGGRISDDFTEGFGPEQFLLKKARKGKYRIEINYYGDHQATLAGPTTVMAEIYLHYGMPNEEKRIITLQMEEGKDGAVYIGEVVL